jgi:hypothetical protein
MDESRETNQVTFVEAVLEVTKNPVTKLRKLLETGTWVENGARGAAASDTLTTCESTRALLAGRCLPAGKLPGKAARLG